MLKTFGEVVAFLESFTNLERQTDHYTTRTYRLDRMEALLAHLGHPERSFSCLHVAGSKGKGSTSAYLQRGLSSLGYRTGLYLSPHLTDYRERFLVDGSFARDEDLVACGNELQASLASFRFTDAWGPTHPTTFELYTAFAYLLYRRLGCTWAVLETGLGGRLDATNTVDPVAAVLTPIELEHTKILGGTIGLIATEKSKIIRHGRPVFVSHQQSEAMEVFRTEARSQEAPLYALDDALERIESRPTFHGEDAVLWWKDGTKDELHLAMTGLVQAQNCALALLTLRTLGLFDTTKSLAAMEAASLPGRFELIARDPAVYVDGAHTVNSLSRLLETFDRLYPDEGGRVAVYGALLDKDHAHMCRLMEHSFDHIIVSTPGTYKQSDITAIWRLFREQCPGKDIRLIPDNRKALETARSLAGTKGAVLVCGSFYLAGAITRLVHP